MESGVEVVTREIVQKALDEREYRSNLEDERELTEITSGISVFIGSYKKKGGKIILTHGKEIGQVNGLSVWEAGRTYFGRPFRITATTCLGEPGIIHIDKESENGGPSHNKVK